MGDPGNHPDSPVWRQPGWRHRRPPPAVGGKILELRDELARQLQRQLTLRQEIEEAIAGVEDERLRELLRLRYLLGWTWERVASQRECEERHTYRLHAIVLGKLLM